MTQRWTPEKIAELQTHIAAGVPVAVLAEAHSVSRGRMYAVLRKHDVLPPKPEPKARKAKRPLTNQSGRLALEEGQTAVRKTIAFSASQAAWLEEQGNVSEVVRALVNWAMKKNARSR